ncbi:FdhF/YdeP family oxidoreductase [Rhodococcus sp. X156]|uniref:FdhF/YdeP family oxidoreductase n=1 Tax=Rhodococcus sp. X156 TaxID=2499145 RepID=UPI000FD9846E|nr:FdhF/YdeP family oxidoreductase [Rhodococcus sp. X156]
MAHEIEIDSTGGHKRYRGKVRRPDIDESSLKVTKPEKSAAGVPAVLVAAQRGLKLMGADRTARTWLRINQRNGFDCPSCAWPEPADGRKTFEFCENGAKAVADDATTRTVTPEFFAQHSIDELNSKSSYWLNLQGRLTHPMVVRPGGTHYEPISWDDAIALVADELNGLASPDEALFYTSGRASNESAFVFQLLARSFGTNNLPDCSNMCHESSGHALTESIGIGKGTVTILDVQEADLIIIAGQNPGTNHPRMLSFLEEAKHNGAKIVAINPLLEAGLRRFHDPQSVSGVLGNGTKLADEYLQIKLGGDMVLFRALAKMLLQAEEDNPGSVVDRTFIDTKSAGFEEWAQAARDLDLGIVEEATGLKLADIEKVAALMASSQRTVLCWAMGLTQHRAGVATIQEGTNLMLMRGMIGKPGAGLCPVRGHSNVQGDRTMGIWEQMPEGFLAALDTEFGITCPRPHGVDTVGAMHAMKEGKAKVFISLGGNFASATSDTDYTEEGLRQCSLTVQISTKLNRSHLAHGRTALILPCLSRTDRDIQNGRKQKVSVEDSMSMVHLSRGNLKPVSEDLLSEIVIMGRLALATLGTDHPVPWRAFMKNYDTIRDSIARVVGGCEDYNQRVRQPDGFMLPNPPRDGQDFTDTDNGKANFVTNELEWVKVPPGRLVLQSLRSHDQFNSTIYGLDDRYRGIDNARKVVMVNPQDITELGLTDGAVVNIISEYTGKDGVLQERRAEGYRVVSYDTPKGNAAGYYPETNVLYPVHDVARKSNTPVSKAVVVRLEPVG